MVCPEISTVLVEVKIEYLISLLTTPDLVCQLKKNADLNSALNIISKHSTYCGCNGIFDLLAMSFLIESIIVSDKFRSNLNVNYEQKFAKTIYGSYE